LFQRPTSLIVIRGGYDMAAIELPVAWFVYRAGHQHGPMPGLELALLAKANVLRHSDLIWCEGLLNWVEAGAVDGLLQDSEEPPAKIGGLTQAYLDAREKAVHESRPLVQTLSSAPSGPPVQAAPTFARTFAREGVRSKGNSGQPSSFAVNLPAASGRIAPLLPLEFAAAPAM
jgi:hypothetical protein